MFTEPEEYEKFLAQWLLEGLKMTRLFYHMWA